MNKFRAHIILGVFDIAAFFGAYTAYKHASGMLSSIRLGSESISFESSTFYYLLALIIPVLHCTSLFNKRIKTKLSTLIFNVCLAFATLAILSSKYIIATKIESVLSNTGYIPCEETYKGKYQRVTYRKQC